MKSLWSRLPNYSPVIADRLRSEGRRAVCFWIAWFALIGGTSGYMLTEILKGAGNEVLAGMVITIFIFSMLPAYGSLKSKIIEEPNLMSYFSGKVPGSGLGSGFALLKNSQKIDEYAVTNRLKPFASMISDDDLFDRKPLSWGSPDEALTLVQRLLSSDEDYIIDAKMS
ncbi:MAG: hypothetical protein K0R17_3485 [Rariglobus sp.]|jgi:hypothetical protein|nr:hypothetical protein [Rariglobus sp.]